MREALQSRSTLLVVAALLAGGAGGFALGRVTDESATTVGPIPQSAHAIHAFIDKAVPAKPVPKKLAQRCAIPARNPHVPLGRAIQRALPSLPPRCRELLNGGPPPSPPPAVAPGN